MMIRQFFRHLALAALLVCSALNSLASDQPSPIVKINLRDSGYTPNGGKTIVRFWRQYVVITQVNIPGMSCNCHAKTPTDITTTGATSPAVWIFDLNTRKVVAQDAVTNADWEPLPETAPP